MTIFAQYDSVERRFGSATDPLSRDNRVMVGLTLDGLDGLLGAKSPTTAVSYGVFGSSRGSNPYAGSTALIRWSAERYPTIGNPKRVVRIALDRPVDDRKFVRQLLKLHELSRDKNVAGIVLEMNGPQWGWGRAEELRGAIKRFRAAGKKVVAYLGDGDILPYYVAAACDRVFVHPTASLYLTGVDSHRVYYRDFFDRIGVAMQTVKIAEYKSAPESFTRNASTEKAREQYEIYIADVVEQFVAKVAEDRGKTPAEIRGLFDRAALNPVQAEIMGLVDGTLHPDELDEKLRQIFGSIHFTTTRSRPTRPDQWAFPRIAVIHVDGGITGGRSRASPFGTVITGDTIAKAIRAARKDNTIKAIIVRVNSPGGAVQPSERIAREMELTRGKKPIIVSMGDVAASGGYMASVYSDRVYAEPSTLTGSIGIFALRFSIQDMMLKLGLASETTKIGKYSDSDAPFRLWTEDERAAVTEQLVYLYQRFLGMVAAGRNMPIQKVGEVARGRVWSGQRAAQNGLVDQIGGFMDAYDEARRRSGVWKRSEIEVVHLPKVPSNLLSSLLGVKADAKAAFNLPNPLRALLEAIPPALWWGDGMFAMLPWTEAR